MSVTLHVGRLYLVLGLLFGWGTVYAQKTLNVNVTEIPVIDPTANWLYDIPANVFVPLVSYDFERSEVTPAGADSWEVSEDGTTYTFHIREGWSWSDGTPVNAADYAYAFERIADPATAAPMAYRIYVIKGARALNQGESSDVSTLGVKAEDDHTLVITLEEPASWFLSSLATIGHAVPRWTISEYGDAWTLPQNIVANGPYTLSQLEPENLAVLEKNPSYFDAADVDIDLINLYVVNEESTALSLYEDDELDIVSVPATDLDRIKNDPDLAAEFYNGPKNVLYYYAFNASQPPFDEVTVRQAFAAAIDKQGIVSFITRGGEVPAPTLTPPGSVGYVAEEAGVGIPFDPERAKTLLAESGYPGGEGFPAVTLGFNSSEGNSRIAQAIQQMWRETLGVEVTLQPSESSSYSQIAGEGAFSIWRGGWGMDYPDANNIHSELFTSDVGTPAMVHDEEYDRIIAEAAVDQDLAAREKMYVSAEKILVQDLAGVVPIYWSAENLLIKPYLTPVLSGSFNREFWKWTLEN